jgi:hypothetical protein
VDPSQLCRIAQELVRQQLSEGDEDLGASDLRTSIGVMIHPRDVQARKGVRQLRPQPILRIVDGRQEDESRRLQCVTAQPR